MGKYWTSHNERILFLLGFFVLGVFVIFSYFVHKNLFTQFDFDNTVHLQDHLSLRWVGPFSFLSQFGQVEIVSVILLVILAMYRKLSTFLVFVFFGLFHFVEIYGKTFVHHNPPPHFMLKTIQIVNLPQFYVSTQNSYPSGHAGRALFLTTFLGLMTIKTKRLSTLQKYIILAVMLSYDFVMGLSRVYLGEHWTSDVIGGSLLGISCALFAAALL